MPFLGLMGQNGPKMVQNRDTTICSKLIELECSFFVLPPHFLTSWVDINHFHTPPVTGSLIFFCIGCHKGSKRLKNGWYNHIFQTNLARMFIFCPTTPFFDNASSFKPFPDSSSNWLPTILGLGVPKYSNFTHFGPFLDPFWHPYWALDPKW